MTETSRLRLPLIAPEQAQKHVTHNEALLLLDGAVQLRLAAVDVSQPPSEPEPGAAYAIGENAEEAWDGKDGRIGIWTGGGWRFLAPEEGWMGWDASDDRLVVFRGGVWAAPIESVPALGIGTAPDGVNGLAVRAEAALFSAVDIEEGGTGDVRLTLNKQGQTDSATLIFQSGWSGRAEIGLAGENDFSFKVSPDGTQFVTAMTLDGDNGFVAFERMVGARPSFPLIEAGSLHAETSLVVPALQSGTSAGIEQITGGFDGALLVITGTAGHTLTFHAGTGNLKLGADRVLDAAGDALMLVRRGDDWIELGFARNG